MARRKRNRNNFLLNRAVIFLLVFLVVFLGIQFFTKTGLFFVPGVVHYDESLNEEELAALNQIFTDEITLSKDVTIRAEESETLGEINDGEYLYQISVPVGDFYDEKSDIEEISEEEYEWIPVSELDFSKKLLSINGKYYLDDFKSGAKFRKIIFESEKFDEEIAPLVESEFKKTFPDEASVLTFAQTGVTALSRGMNQKLSEVSGDATFFSKKISDFLSGFDLTHTSNESSFSDSANSKNICSDKRFINTLTSIGLDIVELTGNHNQDCGNQSAIDTIDTYDSLGIQVVGGGKNSEEASRPLEINEKNTGITFLAYNQSTGGATHGDTPGANQYYEENAVSEINSAKERGDFVIVDVQYYECSAYVSKTEDATCDYANSSAGDQVGFFRHLIDLGADMVVGTSAHQPQTFELYGDGVIYYGLGNLFFDQVWWPGTTRSLVLGHYFYNGKLLQTKIFPTAYDNDMKTGLLDKEEAEWFLNRLISVHP
ncbi:CapA family protein [Candidatus Saccharibacteria bacterium]|nr:CapA family protein [Candidatus Saccharibacteria bacterium]